MLIGLITILVLVAATGFFVASEFALVSVRKTRIEQLISEGNGPARLVKAAMDNIQVYIAVTQVGITLASLGLGYIGEPVLSEVLVPVLDAILPHQLVDTFLNAHGIAFVLSFLIVTILEIILGELVPKMIARQRPDTVAMVVIRPLNLFAFIFKPLIWLINPLGNMVLRMIGLGRSDEHANVHSVEELEMLVTSSRQAGVLEAEEEAILRRVFDLSDLAARQVMVPRTEVTAIPVDAPPTEVIELMRRETHSRFPVYDGDLDNIRGVLYVKDVFMLMTDHAHAAQDGAADRHSHAFEVRSLMREILNVPETLSVNDLLAQMQRARIHIAVVVDEYGGTAGIVTLEDVLEEIVGEVQDEFETEDEQPDIRMTPDGTLVNGLTLVEEVNERLGLALQGDSDTVGGYVFEQLGRKPELGDEVSVDGHVLRVEGLDGLRISEIRVLPRTRVAAAPDGGEEE